MTTYPTRATSDWVRDQIKANKTPVCAKKGSEYFSLSKRYASQMDGTFNVTMSAHEIVVDLNSQIRNKPQERI